MPPALTRRLSESDAMPVSLRPIEPDDFAFDVWDRDPLLDFGPRRAPAVPPPPDLDDRGALTIVTEDGSVAGDVSWHWRKWGPNAASRCPMIGIWLRPESRGRGTGTAAQAQLVDLFFRHTQANRVEAHTGTASCTRSCATTSPRRIGGRPEMARRAPMVTAGAHRAVCGCADLWLTTAAGSWP